MQVQSILLALLLTGSVFLVSQFENNQNENGQGNIRQDIYKIYQNWKQENGMIYQNSQEDYRFQVFKKNYEWIQQYNKEVGYEAVGLNHMAGLTKDEYIQTYLQKVEESQQQNTIMNAFEEEDSLTGFQADLPTSVDWVQEGAVTTVQDAGSCSASYAIAPVSAIASCYKLAGNKLIPLSAQQIISCDKNSAGCRGGSPIYSYLYAMQYGVMSNETYPYTSKNGNSGSCKYDDSEILYKPLNMYQIKSGSPDIMKKIVAQQPITAKVDATDDSFRFYRGGETPYHSNFCLTKGQDNISYSVLITGYNEEVEKPYWILQASFGTKWGNDGYMYLQNKSGYGYCGVNKYPSFPGMTK
ncbi:hypothetical protein PPERSA_12167 [Pseudocohnilembus persalinus]|uniref:Peptidase C1A papain C-terminal domain-containing protein n=1 Tax=Pseudocohnilembus persalinus TaxID=266149 RepID=A0A0V0R9F8_PSEPJ|nr:hypothetical protein PPERSA_12167 [Pseudocohnilembus persalinus]|eukprot:KRX10885.1 hypothetical protein PPERSA_12167 [Pseudocohnilembus persalinus]